MFKREYHCLVAGLPDLVLERDVKNFDFKTLVRDVYDRTSEQDQMYIRELFLEYDFMNFLRILRDRDDLFIDKGFYSLEFFKERLDVLKEHPELLADEIPEHLLDIVRRFLLVQEVDDQTDAHLDMASFTRLRFYQRVEKSGNRFIRSWFQFDHLLRNIQSAWMCRKLNKSVQKQLVGYSEEIEFFVKNNLPDFGLRHEISLGEQIFGLFEESETLDILEREFRFDQIRWQMADELTIFNYFDMDKVLAFLAKADILDRWLNLDKERGTELFDGFVKNLVELKNKNL
ncbi:MAG: DUF2764 domain-containing protein [Bacteroidales bacterium]|nr:DUF2764 domain-containing protein [Bacteroidales bacterium]